MVGDRLNVLGYDLATAKEAFRTWISEEHDRAQEMAGEWKDKDSDSKDLMEKHYKKECEILSALSPENWIENLKVIQASGLETNYYGRYEGPHHCCPVKHGSTRLIISLLEQERGKSCACQ